MARTAFSTGRILPVPQREFEHAGLVRVVDPTRAWIARRSSPDVPMLLAPCSPALPGDLVFDLAGARFGLCLWRCPDPGEACAWLAGVLWGGAP